jgi:predicted nucleotidyltransferase
MLMRAREGDFIESIEGLIFDVKGLVHPPDRLIAFIRYYPDEKGSRKRQGTNYSKVYSLSERFQLLSEKFPEYIVYDSTSDAKLCEVPIQKVRRRYKPTQKLEELRGNPKCLDELEKKALELADIVKMSANIFSRKVGVSGSIMVGLHNPRSDIDLIVYGVKNCRKVYSTMENLLGEKQGPFKPYTHEGLKALFDFRSKDTVVGFEDFVRSESRKVLQGKFMGTDYFIRFVKDWSEIDEKYGDVQYVNVGYARIKATVADDSESIFTPCVYKIDDVHVFEGNSFPVTKIASFRGRFCEQARNGEVVIAQGKVEHVIDNKRNRQYFRLLLGNKPSDYFVTIPNP